MMSWMTPLMGGAYESPSVLYWTGFLYHLVMGSELSMLSTSLPVMISYAQSHGFNPIAVAMVWAFASGGKLFMYQSSVLIQGFVLWLFRQPRHVLGRAGLTIVGSGIILARSWCRSTGR